MFVCYLLVPSMNRSAIPRRRVVPPVVNFSIYVLFELDSRNERVCGSVCAERVMERVRRWVL